MNPKCDVCGAVGAEGQVFVSEAVLFCKRKSYCPNCHQRLYQRVYLVIFGSAFVFGMWGLILLLRNPHSESGWIFLNLLLLQICFALVIVPHELGHAFAARLMGFKVQRILLGFGKRLVSFRLFGFDTELNRIPMGGLCLVQPESMRVPLWKYFVLVAAGPLVNLVLGLVCWLLFARDYSISKTFSSLTLAPSAALFVTANLIVVLENLFPWVVKTPLGDAPSDGMALWQILVERRVPHVPMLKVSRGKTRDRLVTGLRWMATLVLAGASVFVGIGGWWLMLSKRDGSEGGSVPVFALAFFTGLGAALLWLAWRIAMHRSPTASVSHMQVLLLSEEMRTQSSQEHQAFIGQTVTQWQALETKGDSTGALNILEQGLNELPNEISFLLIKATSPLMNKTPGLAAGLFERILKEHQWSPIPRSLLFTYRMNHLVDAGEYALVKPLMEECLALSTPPEYKVQAPDHVGTHVLSAQVKELWEAAVGWIDAAILLQPQKLTLKGTKGALLVELGKDPEGEALLREVCAGSQENVDQGIGSLYLGMVAKRKGNMEEAKALAARAAQLYPQPWIISRIEREFPETRKSEGKE